MLIGQSVGEPTPQLSLGRGVEPSPLAVRWLAAMDRRCDAAGAQPFETLTGEFEAHPFQFSGPLLVAPAADKVPYLLTTHWSSADHFSAWKSSSSYRELQSLGDVSSEVFVPLVETRPREHLRADKLQRDWEWTLEDQRHRVSGF